MARLYDRPRSAVADANVNAAPSGSGSAPPVSFPKRFGFRSRSRSRTRGAEQAAVPDVIPSKLDQAHRSQDQAVVAVSGRRSTEADRAERQERGRTNRNDAQRGTGSDNASPALHSSSRARSRNASREPGASVSDTEGSGVFKRVTTQFRRRMSGALPQHSSTQNRQSSYGPPMPSDFTNKEQREQALRERGLIPASRRDLSALEASRDLHKTYVKPLSDEEAGRGGKTAAMLIREQYEARERQLAQGQQSRSVPASNNESTTSRMVLVSGPRSAEDHKDDLSGTLVVTPGTESVSELQALSSTSSSSRVPSLPLPALPTTSGSFAERFARMPPAPSRKPPSTPIQTSLPTTTTDSTSKDLPALPPTNRNIPSPSSPTQPALNKSNSTSTRHTSSDEVPSLTRSSSDAPSSSSLRSPTSPIQSKDVEMRDVRRRSSTRSSTGHVYGPIDGAIATSPQEAPFSPLKRIAEMEMRSGYDEHGVARGRQERPEKSKTLPAPPVTARSSSVTPSESSRKSFSLFGKKSISGASSDSEGLSLKSSFTSLRRTFNSADKHKRPKTEHGPPPSSFGGKAKAAARPQSAYADQSNSRRPGVGPRAPLNPTIHSRGSIVSEMRGIENDESRRLSEMAFLD